MALPVNKRVPKILFILFVVAFCVYTVSNALGLPLDDRLMP